MALTGGTVVANAITACATPVVTRLYTPAQIGVISLFLAFFGFWSSLLSWRYESALLIASDDAESHVVFRVGSLCVVLMSVFALPALLILRNDNVLGFGLLPWWSAWLTVPILLGYGQFMMYRSWALRGGIVKDIGKAAVARSASNVITRVVLGTAGVGVPGLFAAELMGAWGATGSLYRNVNRRFAASRPSIDWPKLKTAMMRYSKFATFELPSTAINQLALTIPVPMVAALYGPTPAGWFGLARLIVAIPNAQIGAAVADVFQMELARAVREHRYADAKQLFFKLLRKLALFGLLPLALTMVLGPTCVPFVLGSSWTQMGIISACIAPWLYAALVVSTLSRLLSVLQVQQYKLAYDILTTSMTILVYFIARSTAMGMMHMIELMSASNVIAYGGYLALLVFVARTRLRDPAVVRHQELEK
jgi:O-antigen/teichoic acid export membrane protein